ncbi:hypothetical protein AALP_AA2G029900, partial [Arabis alpina]
MRFVYLQGKGNPETALSSLYLCGFSCWVRAFSGASYDYREKTRDGFLQLDDAIGLFSDMVKSRPLPSISDFNKLLSAIVKMKKFDVVISLVSLVDQMVVMGYKPDTVTFNTLIHGLFLNNKVSEAVALVDRMVLKGCQPSLVTYGVDRLGEAKQMFGLMVSRGCLPDVVTYNTLINGFCKAKRVDDGIELFREMSQRGLVGDTVNYNTLVQG